MKIRILIGMIFSVALITLSGCGGGGSSTPAPPVIPPGTPTVVSGTPFKGRFDAGASVKIFGVDASGLKEATPRATTQTDTFGKYGPVTLSGLYTGPIVVEVIGTYADEATGAKVIMLPAGPPLRAVISDAKGDVQVNVTPLTELAAKAIGPVLNNKTTIDTINTSIATLFNVGDITKTNPVDATTAASATATAAEKDQALVLAAFSQLVKNNSGKTLDQVLVDMATTITVSQTGSVEMAQESRTSFKTALFDFITDPTKNKTGVALSGTGTANISTLKIAHLKISTGGALPVNTKIGGIDFTFDLPAGVILTTVPASANLVTSGLIVASGVASEVVGDITSRAMPIATLNGQTLRTIIANSLGFGLGEFVNISCTVQAGTLTAAQITTAIQTAVSAATPVVTSVNPLAGSTGTLFTGVTLSATVDVF